MVSVPSVVPLNAHYSSPQVPKYSDQSKFERKVKSPLELRLQIVQKVFPSKPTVPTSPRTSYVTELYPRSMPSEFSSYAATAIKQMAFAFGFRISHEWKIRHP